MTNAWSIAAADVADADWPDRGALTVPQVQERLDAAQAQCAAFAPAFDVTGKSLPGDLPPGWRLAVIYQARDIHNAAGLTGDYSTVGDVHAVRVRPLSSAVKALLRPESRTFVVG